MTLAIKGSRHDADLLFERAEKACDRLIERFPGSDFSVQMEFRKFELNLYRQDHDECKRILNGIIENYSGEEDKVANALFARGDVEKRAGKVETAIESFELIPVDNSLYRESRMQIIGCFIELDEIGKAGSMVEVLLEKFPDSNDELRRRFERLFSNSWKIVKAAENDTVTAVGGSSEDRGKSPVAFGTAFGASGLVLVLATVCIIGGLFLLRGVFSRG